MAGQAAEVAERRKLVSFEVARERYALDALRVHSIIRPDCVTRVPGAQHPLVGVINLRSSVIPLVSLRRCFGLVDAELDRYARIVVLERDGKFQGLLVDRVLDVFDVTEEQVLRDIPLPDSVDHTYFRHFLKVDDATLLMVDVDRVLQAALDDQAPRLPS